ncbi:uncharacterized protein MYCFIDRAFT_195518 [Pseudocercospora fijiensis CIRAD86]|uniref:SWI5-dependent HO expression protein 3 n=1 Tax=Pseudocercospora fijiensis (strain CIRAD86) TaxID=383855 RepID=M3B552_PSEFD|nr:uncharacterized protein MYCFIDRAFT_195518 [Pseudocercospora fijiensis CIRAD86]EME84482.1 hypothetical protein MYCFIDRAFT_195518 [Pseudocercospora fijiensis CIRAD86]
MSPSTLTGSVVRNPSPSQSPSPREPGNFDLATLKRQFQNLSEAFIQLQARHGKELEETKKAFSDLREEHNDYKKAFSDLREAHNESKTTVHWRLKKIEADLAKAFLEINKIRMHMQENLNRQAIDIRKNAEEIALHAKEEWQDASSDGSSVIRSLEQKMTELKVEVKALKNKKAGQRKSLANEDRKLGDA